MRFVVCKHFVAGILKYCSFHFTLIRDGILLGKIPPRSIKKKDPLIFRAKGLNCPLHNFGGDVYVDYLSKWLSSGVPLWLSVNEDADSISGLIQWRKDVGLAQAAA